MSTDKGLRNLFHRLVEHKITIEDLASILNGLKPSSIAVTALSLQDIQKMFSLTRTVDDEFDSVVPVTLPEELKLWLEKSDRALGASSANEAIIRCKLNILLVCAHDLVSSSLDKSARPVNIQMERQWAFSPVKWKGKQHTLSGRPDYGIWYGDEEDIELNVVIVEAKRSMGGTQGIPQALAYMACVHRQRKVLGKEDTTVYGISTDTIHFIFMKLDNESRWSMKPVCVFENEFQQVLGLLVYLMKKTASMSPTTSKRSSRRTHQGSGDSDLIFDHNPDMDEDMDDELGVE
ncbi:uncharacterized protein N7506_005164 [Penicillium brevicompactum]|uniref:uncharacterized protein n=1 Tax=Penicillium brevicompactum TaxID=5074 RepID=UPI002541FE5C|nr:uncharacterized protein N7506_005164 [Penicillium brevicompactum]KAJ5337142.1 hypothetical protein N7506_005164 [Penicillium brevicompactum]